MQELPDLSPFQWETLPPPSHSGGMEFFHIRSRRSYRMRSIAAGHGVDDLLAAECFCEVQLLKGAHYMRRNAPFLSLEYVRKGELLVRQRNRGYRLEPGELFLMQPEIENEFVSGADGCHKISVMITGKMLMTYLRESGLGETDVVTGLDRHHIERLLHRLDELAETGDRASPEQNALRTFELLQYLRTPPEGDEVPEALALLHNAFEEDPGFAWTRELMAERCRCTPAHLTRQFRRYFNTTPYRMLLELRMRRARHLLEREELSVKEIASAVGYPNALNFSTEFRRRTGMSPREYRRHIAWLS